MIKVISTETGIQLESRIQVSPFVAIAEKQNRARANAYAKDMGLNVHITDNNMTIAGMEIGMSPTLTTLENTAKKLHDKHTSYVEFLERLTEELSAEWHNQPEANVNDDMANPANDIPSDEEIDKIAKAIIGSIFDGPVIVLPCVALTR